MVRARCTSEAKTPLILLFSVTAVVLLIACANIANLLLARGAGRATEMGVRLALGGTRRNLVTQLLVESVMLAAVGGIASLVVAQWTLSGIGTLLPPDAMETMTFKISGPVILFSALLSMATGVMFGLFPAMHSTRSDLIGTIRAGAGQIAGGRAAARFRFGLVTAQIALSMGLLIMSALFLKSLMNVSRVDLGLEVDHIATFEIVPRRAGYDTVRSAVLFDRVEQELAALPGVTGVTDGRVPLLSGSNWGNSVVVQGYDCGPDVDCGSRFNQIGADYFKTLGVQVISGREFTTSDREGSQRVAIINEEFAKKFNLGKDAVGKFMGDDDETDSLNIQIVGVVPNVKYSQVKDTIPPVFYRPWRQDTRRRKPLLLRAIDAAAGADARDSAWHDEAHRPEHPGRGAQDDAAAGEGERLPRPDDLHPLERVRAAGDAARWHRAVRRARLLGDAAHARDRRAHGARRRCVACAEPGDASGGHDAAHRRRRRHRRGHRAGACRALAAVRASGTRSGGDRDRRRAARARRAGGRLHSSQARRARESDECAALRLNFVSASATLVAGALSRAYGDAGSSRS